MKISIAAFTRAGALVAARISDTLQAEGHTCRVDVQPRHARDGLLPRQGPLSLWTREAFRQDAVIFVGAAGIAVRAIAPYVLDKQTDPCVLCVDEQGRYAVCLLSGHTGGGNALTLQLAGAIGAAPVISTATDLNGLFAVDVWAGKNSLLLGDRTLAKEVSAALLDGEPVGFYSDFEPEGALPAGLVPSGAGGPEKLGVCVSLDPCRKPFARTLNAIPRIVTLGLGCGKNVPMDRIETEVLGVLERSHVSLDAVKAAASIDIKSAEPGILEFCEKYSLPFQTFPAKVLSEQTGPFVSSPLVLAVTGVDNVCERAAVAASGGTVLIPKHSGDRVTVAAAVNHWRLRFED